MPTILNICLKGKQVIVCALAALLFFSSFHYPCQQPARISNIESFSQELWDSCKKEILKKLDSLSREFDKNKKIKGKISDRSIDQLWELYHRISRLKDVLKNLDKLEKEKDEIFSVERITEGEGGTVYDLNNGRIVFRILRSIPVASFVHETTHGGQFELGEVVFRKVKKIRLRSIPEPTVMIMKMKSLPTKPNILMTLQPLRLPIHLRISILYG